MRILMVTPYAPNRDGIANYAVQHVKRLRAEGHDVEVLSPGPSAAHHHLDLKGRRGPLALAKRVRGYDRLIVQWHPDVFYPYPATARELTEVTAGLLVCFRSAKAVEVRAHEVNRELGQRRDPAGALARAMWRSVGRIVVHTDTERDELARAYRLDPARIEVVEHGGHFERRTGLTQADARRRLGLPGDGHRFLAIGFVQPHKGFDRAVRAFGGLDRRGAALDVVGSVRVEEPEYLAHLEELRDLVAATPGTALHEAYVSDEAFDAWIVAADTIVLPYRFIWSSGVMERARLYGRPVIATRVGGLADQAPPGTTLVDDDDQLRAALWAAVGATPDEPLPAAAVESAPWPAGADHDTVQAEVRRRARAERAAEDDVAGAAPAVDGEALLEVAPTGRGADRRAANLRRVPPLGLPRAVSARPGASGAKRWVRRLTAWQIDPLITQLNRLRDAAIADLEDGGSPPGGSGR